MDGVRERVHGCKSAAPPPRDASAAAEAFRGQLRHDRTHDFAPNRTMTTTARLAEIAALAGEPARMAMLQGLMDGRALTAGELAALAGVTAQTASGHLARLVAAGLLAVVRQGRHRYFRLGAPAVAGLLESLMLAAGAVAPPAPRVGPRDAALREARACYDHIAGRLGVAIADALTEAGHVELSDEAAALTPSGLALADRLGIPLGGAGRLACRPCLDWSERRPHLAGRLGAGMLRLALDRGWARRTDAGRALTVTPEGRRAFRAELGVAGW